MSFSKPLSKLSRAVSSFLPLLLLGAFAGADNPIIQTRYTADPAPFVYDDRVWLFASHDEGTPESDFFEMHDWRLYSSEDMVNWLDHGSPMSLETFSWADRDAWAGQALERNGKFYWYVPMVRTGAGMAIGVGVADNIEGPYEDAIGEPLVANEEIDPHTFIDDDGQAYMYWGNPNLWYLKLNEDMITPDGEPVQVELTEESFGPRRDGDTEDGLRPTAYEEGPWLYKRGDIYYLLYAANCCSEDIHYTTGPSATGPWTYGGLVMATQGGSFTNHPGMVDFKGNSYFFYHNAALPNGGGFARSIAVEQFEYEADGSIPTLEMTDAGAPQTQDLSPYARREAELIAWSEGLSTEVTEDEDGGMNVNSIHNGDYIKVGGVAFGEKDGGASSFSARVASGSEGGQIELRLDSTTGTVIGTCDVPGTGGWQTWTTVDCGISDATETHDLYFMFTGSGSDELFNFNWWQFE